MENPVVNCVIRLVEDSVSVTYTARLDLGQRFTGMSLT